jgi:hypothetical protein
MPSFIVVSFLLAGTAECRSDLGSSRAVPRIGWRLYNEASPSVFGSRQAEESGIIREVPASRKDVSKVREERAPDASIRISWRCEPAIAAPLFRVIDLHVWQTERLRFLWRISASPLWRAVGRRK